METGIYTRYQSRKNSTVYSHASEKPLKKDNLIFVAASK